MPYRFELASTGRAGCQNKDCKDNKIKIDKGTLRTGTWIDNERFQSWSWRHWGCTTPLVLQNIKESIGGEGEDEDSLDFDALDGFDEVPLEMQEKIKTALVKGHVEDEEWNGDVEFNRPGMRGMHARKPRAKKESKDASPKKTKSAATENGKTAEAESEAEAQSPAKTKGKAKGKKGTENTKEASNGEKKPTGKRKKADPAPEAAAIDGDENDDEKQPAPKRTRATRTKKEVTKEENDEAPQIEKRGRPSKNTTKPKTDRAKKSAQETDTEAKAVNMGKPKRGRSKQTKNQDA
ncbi:uncharacterized protein N7469_004253 [Penicillium citrinum]|uniref:PARP-type domain-containing protein n=1 Tax=Penicillium citrinum TaxID=5077 RepID=A0A9W9P495_PENCI|nr:uncharacterized protein N7469_004253 [Penicillium citrinum]KAJ5235085.1 hypothetical protein N7469_004253 [Penicillium citrinum]